MLQIINSFLANTPNDNKSIYTKGTQCPLGQKLDFYLAKL